METKNNNGVIVDSWLCNTLFSQIKCDVESKQIQPYYGTFIGIWRGRLLWDLSYLPKDIFLLKCFIIRLSVAVFVAQAFMSLWFFAVSQNWKNANCRQVKFVLYALNVILNYCWLGADPGFGFWGWKLPTKRSRVTWAKRAICGQGPGPLSGPWKLLGF